MTAEIERRRRSRRERTFQTTERREARDPFKWGMGPPVWTVVYVASGWTEAERIKNILTREGLLVMLRTTCAGRDGRGREVELLVPEIEARDAHALIMQIKGTARV